MVSDEGKRVASSASLTHMTFHFSVPHNHESEDDRIDEARQKGCLHFKTLNEVAEEYDLKVAVRHDKDNDVV